MAVRKRAAPERPTRADLRALADVLTPNEPESSRRMSAGDIRKLVHELRVHQVELEMQNEELRRAQGEIEESRSRYVDLYDFSPVGHVTLDQRSRIIEANLTAASLLNTARRDLVGIVFSQFVAPECLDDFVRFKSRVLKADARLTCELDLRKRDGTHFWASVEGILVKDRESGQPRLLCALSDITERKQAEEEIRRLNADLEDRVRLRTAQLEEANRFLRKAHAELERRTEELRKLMESLEERVLDRTSKLAEVNAILQAEIDRRRSAERERLRLEAAANQAAEGIVITDPGGIIQYVNPAFERDMGLGRNSLIGSYYQDFLNRDRGGNVLSDPGPHTVRPGRSWSSHVKRQGPAGQAREVDISVSPIKDQSGTVINYLAIERDVTEQLRLDDFIRRSQKMEALGTMAGGIAHDFNNILTPIIINMELALLDLPDDSPLRSYIEMPLKAAQRGKEVINQIITFSRQKKPDRKRLKISPIVKETLKFLAPSLPSSVQVEQNIRPENDWVAADPGQIHQLVMNLCNNAIYAMRKSGGVLAVDLEPVELDQGQVSKIPGLKLGPYLKLAVRDTGSGMTPEVKEKAFDPFFTTKERGDGAGMGLTVVLSIVKSLRGAVVVESEPGKGSLFTVCLPRQRARPALRESVAKSISRGRERVLVVDDDKVQVETLQKALEKLGYRASGMSNSAEALALFRASPADFDLIITDQSMPEITGLQLAEEVLKLRPGFPVILCTGFSETVDQETAQAAGIRKLILKPFTIREMALSIRQALGKPA